MQYSDYCEEIARYMHYLESRNMVYPHRGMQILSTFKLYPLATPAYYVVYPSILDGHIGHDRMICLLKMRGLDQWSTYITCAFAITFAIT